MILGFTGTSSDPTDEQEQAVRWLIETNGWIVSEGHHGDCIGADAMFDRLCHEFGIERHVHPGCDDHGNSPKRAHCPTEHLYPVKRYHDRNRDIVDASDILLACPHGPERVRSGTWSTVRYARKNGCRIIVIWPDGRTEG